MSIRTAPWPAESCWVDLQSPDVAAAQAFYADVLGWTYEDPSVKFGGYAVAECRGAAVAGIGPRPPGASVAWTLYFASDDADKTAAAVAEHGGAIVIPPGDVGELGRMFVASDPTGAPFGVWQAGTHIGAGLVNEPGGLTWEDLRSPDPDTARDFYTAVFGFRTDPLTMAGPDYTTFALPSEEAPLGGIGGMMGASGMPAHWLVYFAVGDIGAAVAAAERAGGTVLVRDFDTPFGRMAGLVDPAGAVFWLAQTGTAAQPDRAE
jgi:predicted enzyme related to lactoylglutathione lyase